MNPTPRKAISLVGVFLATAIFVSQWGHFESTLDRDETLRVYPIQSEKGKANEASSLPDLNQFSDKELRTWALERRRHMKELISYSPEEALREALSYGEFESLPDLVKGMVERPFSDIVDYQVRAICDHKSHQGKVERFIVDSSGRRIQVVLTQNNRLPVSKEGIPLQGIELDGIAVIRKDVFQVVEDADLIWAKSKLTQATIATNKDPNDRSIYAISGGSLFEFSDYEQLQSLESKLSSEDTRPGLTTGSSAYQARLKSVGYPIEMESSIATQSVSTDETRDYLIIRVEFSNIEGTPFEKDSLQNLLDTHVSPTLAYYSYNKSTVSGTVTDKVYQLSNSANYSDSDDLYDDAVAAYIADGNPNPNTIYDHVAISFPDIGFSWAGLASVGGREQWLQGSVDAETIVHELGHNYGLSHALYWDFGNSSDPVSPSGSSIDYGDIFDIMGSGGLESGHFNMAAKEYLDWIDSSSWSDLSSESDNGTYRIYAFDNVSASGLQALRIKKSEAGGYYWLGLRQEYPGIANLNRGAYLTWQQPGTYNNQTNLVDTTPLSASGKTDAGLTIGKTYSDELAGVHITPLEYGTDSYGAYIDVSVNFGDFPSNQSPSGTLTATNSGTARSPIPFSFNGSDPDGDDLSYHWDFGDGTVELSEASIDHSFPVGGSYTLTLTVSDQKGGTFTQQATIEVSDPTTETTTRTSGTSARLTSLATDGSFVVAAGDDGVFLRSADGVTWTDQGSLNSNLKIHEMIWTGSEYLAVGMDYNWGIEGWVGSVQTSQTGEFWTEELQTDEEIPNWGILSVAYNPATETAIAIQSDGKLRVRDPQGSWTIQDIGLDPLAFASGGPDGASIIWDGTQYVLGGYDFSQTDLSERLVIMTSVDGTTWTKIDPSDSGLLGWYGLDVLSLLNGQLVGSGFAAGIVFSEDSGQSWSNNSPNSDFEASAFAYGNGVYSAHFRPDEQDSRSARDFLSSDGQTWQPAGESENEYNDRIFFSNTFISIGDNGLIVQSAPFSTATESEYESWISGYFSSSTQQGADNNPDGDWATNFMEYALGSDPSNPNSVPQLPSIGRDAGDQIIASIPRFALSDVIVTLELSNDLENWTEVSTTKSVDSESLLELTTTQSYPESDKAFFRIAFRL
ncbi:PKD domain-containing protein [Pelagicoccus albus]|uniref:PKD domain-containing protein n=1 Tax=Pelagicoccus albus TaxID=415222 RepID=A0A7X1E7R3_9BACT|nr:PKD domain-containing protein [Pelagicoccus albus]MBC2605539.1 PKD domain-containing protein [Pelagicoccus albus]